MSELTFGSFEEGWCGEGQASGHVLLYKKFNCSGEEAEVTHLLEVGPCLPVQILTGGGYGSQ